MLVQVSLSIIKQIFRGINGLKSEILFAVLCGSALLCLAAAVPAEKIHEQMTEAERMEISQTIGEDVQDYEIVRIHWPRLQKRNVGTGIRFMAFGRNINLWLKPTDGILAGYDTPVYRIKNGVTGYIYERYSKLLASIEKWEDLSKSAALVVRREGNDTLITGQVSSENLAIRPMPEHLAEEVKRKRRSIDGFSEEEQNDHHYHIVYKIPELPEEIRYISKFAAFNDSEAKLMRASATIPDTVYPEILVVVTYDLLTKLGTIPDAVAYILAFWNGVDLKYRNLENPKFRLNIAAIILAGDDKVLSYITNNKYGRNSLIVNDAMEGSADFWYKQSDVIDVYSYDVAITMAPYELCTLAENGECEGGILGLAYVAAACKVYPSRDTMRKVGIIQDLGAFDGIHTAAHELGHLFGASHDGTDNTDCPADEGHLMAGVPALTDKTSDWSECSLKDIQEFLDSEPVCLYNKPEQKHVLPRYLPGRFMDADKQCSILEGTKACKIEASICQRLGCVYKDNPRYCNQRGSAAAEGTKCGENMLCLHGQCVQEALLDFP